MIVSGRAKLGIVEPYQTGSGEKRWVQTDGFRIWTRRKCDRGCWCFTGILQTNTAGAACREREELLRLVMAASVNSLLVWRMPREGVRERCCRNSNSGTRRRATRPTALFDQSAS